MNSQDLGAIGSVVISTLASKGFQEVSVGRGERIFKMDIPNTRIAVTVYTSVVGNSARQKGADAIRVAALYTMKNGKTRGLVKETRVNRVGTPEEIAERMLERARSVWKSAKTGCRCERCGAPKFKSKKGNAVCAEACWAN